MAASPFPFFGGTYTTKYLISAKMWPAESEAAFFHSVVIHKTELLAVIDFLQGIADKSAKAAKSAVERYVRENGIALTEAQERGISLFLEPQEIPPSK